MREPNEQLKLAQLAERVTQLEEENEALREKIDRIKTHPLWKASAPARALLRNVSHQAQRVKRQGSVSGVLRKLRNKKLEKDRMADYGTKSFPSEEKILEERREIALWIADANNEGYRKPPRFSIVTPLYNTPEAFLREMIESVLAQTYEDWELCLADGSDEAHAYVERVVREYTERDAGTRKGLAIARGEDTAAYGPGGQAGSRIVYRRLAENRGISGNTNECLALATGNYIGLLDHDDVLHPEALYLYAKEILEHDADYLYSDETTFSGSVNHMLTMHFKPDYAIDNLRANNYICHFSVFKKELLEGEELFRPQFDGSQDHDMILRLTDRAQRIAHVPRILYYWRAHEGSTAAGIEAKTYAIDAAKGAVADHLKRHGFEHFRITSTRAFETIFKISYEIKGNPKVSIVIPSRDHATDLKRCVDSVLEKSTWDNYEVVIVENGSTEEETFAYYETLKDAANVRVVHHLSDERTPHPSVAAPLPPSPQGEGSYTCEKKSPPLEGRVSAKPTGEVSGEGFNFSDLVNFGVAQTDGNYILLLNNDTEVISANWIEELLMYAQRDDVGAVGAKLLFPDRTIQHAGVVLGLGAHRTAGHSHYGESKENLGYMGRLCYTQNVSAVTGACLMVARKKFDEVNGLDSYFAVSLNDVDFCLRLRTKGYLNVFTPFSQLYHYESKSRGADTDGERAARYERESAHFRERWALFLEKGDPYFNPNFSPDHADFRIAAGLRQ